MAEPEAGREPEMALVLTFGQVSLADVALGCVDEGDLSAEEPALDPGAGVGVGVVG